MIVISQDGERTTTAENYSVVPGQPYKFRGGHIFVSWAVLAGGVVCGHYAAYSTARKVLTEMVESLANSCAQYQLPPDPEIKVAFNPEYLECEV